MEGVQLKVECVNDSEKFNHVGSSEKNKGKAVKMEKQDTEALTLSDEYLREWVLAEEEEVKRESNGPFIKVSPYESDENDLDSFCKSDEGIGEQMEPSMPATKTNHKVNDVLADELGIQVDEWMKTVCKGAPVTDKAMNLCRFKCPKCNKKLLNWERLIKHFQINTLDVCHKKNCLPSKDNITTRVYCHICKICSERILCDSFFIKQHLQAQHKIIHKAPKRVPRGIFWETILVGYYADKVVTNLCKGAPVSERFSNMCKFKCVDCKKELSSLKMLRTHLAPQTTSNCNQKFKILNVADWLTGIVSHACKICSTLILCDTIFLARHLKREHKMTSREYINKFSLDISSLSSEGLYSENIVGNLCLYQCDACEKQFETFQSFSYHKESTLHESKKNIVKTVYHKCKLCLKTLLCELEYIKNHLRGIHNISFEKYCKTSDCFRADNEELIILKSLKLSNCMANLCIFACHVCSKMLTSMQQLNKHRIAKKHNVNLPKRINCLVKGQSYQCRFCPKLLLCDKFIIWGHMVGAHNLKPVFKKHSNDPKEQYREFCKSFMATIPQSSKIYDKWILPIGQIPTAETTSIIGNLCTFSCPVCGNQEEMDNFSSLRRHSSIIHQQALSYKNGPSVLVKARYHACLLCPRGILSDRYFLAEHLNKQHKMTLAKYEEIFRKHGGKVLPTYREYLKEREETLRNKFISKKSYLT